MKRRNSFRKTVVVVMILGLLAAGLLAGCKKEKGTPVASLGEETIYLEEAVFYTRMMQESWEMMYYEHYGEGMWQVEIDAEAGTLADILKRDVMDVLAEIHLLCIHAKEFGVELTLEERQTISQRADNFMKTNTPAVLEAAGADRDIVEEFLQRNELASKVMQTAQAVYEPELDEEAARVGKLTYALFATTGQFDAEGNQTPYTEEELSEIRRRAEEFEVLAQELKSVSEAGERSSHTVIDVYFNEETDGGAHELVAEEARSLEVGGVSGIVETEEGYYIVQRISEYDPEGTQENLAMQEELLRANYQSELIEGWLQETLLQIDEKLWETVEVKGLLTDPDFLE